MKKLILIAISVLMINSAHGKTEPSHLVLDISKKEIISFNNSDTIRPIASLTKLMTALIIVESEIYMDQEVDYRGRDRKSVV